VAFFTKPSILQVFIDAHRGTPQIPQGDCKMRKWVFWSTCALNRYLNQALGDPLGYQDSDIDVCGPGNIELHGDNQVEVTRNQK
jgi:hypothetical protein